MKRCPTCRDTYEEDAAIFCMKCGSPLLDTIEQSATLPLPVPQIASSPNNVEYIYQAITLVVGNYFDLQTQYIPIRITLREIVQDDFPDYLGMVKIRQDAVRMHVSTGGGVAYAGSRVKQTTVNEFLVPVIAQDDEEGCSVYLFDAREERINFLRIIVNHINRFANKAELNIALLFYKNE